MITIKRSITLIQNKDNLHRIIFSLIFLIVFITYVVSFFNLRQSNVKIDDSNHLLNMTNFNYLINKPSVKIVTDKNNVKLPTFIVIIHSHPYQENLRTKIRETWAKSDPRALVYFVLGAVNTTVKQNEIESEDKIYNDIIQGNFIDEYHNMLYKHTMVLKWFKDYANGIKFLVKIDDDVYANLPQIYKYLMENYEKTEFLAGQYVSPERVNRGSKYAVSYNDFKEEWTPPYAIGNYLIYSMDAVGQIYEKSKTTRWFWLDDVFLLGFCRMQLNIPIIDIKDYVLSHKEMREAWKNENYQLRDEWLFSPPDNHQPSLTQALWDKMKHYNTYALD